MDARFEATLGVQRNALAEPFTESMRVNGLSSESEK
jgi:hypothetical protein